MDVREMLEKLNRIKKLLEEGEISPENAFRIAVELKKIREKIDGEEENREYDCKYACSAILMYLGSDFLKRLSVCSSREELAELLYDGYALLTKEKLSSVFAKEETVDVIEKREED